ncbi:hypothetical protein N7456_003246 [Penicillium angulare]|uniref:Uncharacterized protein n=1 Tax=Penicillium angulare TaxID=116970 RepID=A0A9W9FUA1_9EURO|nr:hypothetical protein N7456_003246 [Penicillium angulare]
MKTLKGTLQETFDSWPDMEKIEHGEIPPPQITRQTILEENQVACISDKILTTLLSRYISLYIAFCIRVFYFLITCSPQAQVKLAPSLITDIIQCLQRLPIGLKHHRIIWAAFYLLNLGVFYSGM